MTPSTWFLGNGLRLRVYSNAVTLRRGNEEKILYAGKVSSEIVVFIVKRLLGMEPERRG